MTRNIYERIADLHDYICDIGKGDPTTIILSESEFAKWYYYCEENDLDYRMWEGKQIILDRDAPDGLVAVSYHPTQKIMNKLG